MQGTAAGAALLLLAAVVAGNALAQEGAAEPVLEGSQTPAELGTSSQGAVRRADPQSIARGKALYTRTGCYSCHGTVGQGAIGPMTGPRIALRTEVGLEAFEYMIRQPPGAMPPYDEKVLSSAEVADLYDYLAMSFTPLKASEIPMLSRHK